MGVFSTWILRGAYLDIHHLDCDDRHYQCAVTYKIQTLLLLR